MDWVETTGRTVEEAKKFALEQLGVDESDAEFEVIAEPKIGLFGRLKEEARVRARIQPRYPRSKGERRDRRRGRGPGPQDQAAVAATSPPSAAVSGQERPPASRGPEAKGPRAGDSPPRASDQTGARRKRRTGTPIATTGTPEEEGTSFGGVNAASIEEQARLAEEFLRGLLSELGATATVTSSEQAEGVIEVLISGDDLGTLIGPKGTTLLALQELTRIVLQRHTAPSEGRLVVDVNGYRMRRQQALTSFAQQVAAEVLASGAKQALEPMPPADRKVVHDAVNGIAGVTTISTGEEPYRRVVLTPMVDEEPTDETDVGGSSQEQSVGS